MKCNSCGTKDLRDFGTDKNICKECKILIPGIKKQEADPFNRKRRIDYAWMLKTRKENIEHNARRRNDAIPAR